MANKSFWPVMLIIALIFGIAIIGCDNGTDAGSGGSDDIPYIVEANGMLNKETSTQLIFTFNEPVSDLKVGDITITETTGKAIINRSIKNNLKGGDTTWTLSITKVTAGKIRVKIDKDGVERSRKTILVHQNISPALYKEDAIELSDSQWEEGSVDGSVAYGEAKWYKFEAEAGKEYRVQWKNKYDQPKGENYTAFTQVIAYKNDGTTTINGTFQSNGYWSTSSDNYWNESRAYSPSNKNLLSGQSGTVYLKVVADRVDGGGTFAIRFYDTANMPKVNISLFSAMATIVPSVSLKWCVPPLSDTIKTSEVTGFRVYRSDTETGTYDQIGGDFIPEKEFKLVNSSSSDADRVIYYDKDVSAGKTYWYRVTAYNKTGETEFSDPIQSEKVPATTPEPLTIGALKVEGTFIAPTGTAPYGSDLPYPIPPAEQADWYTFTAEAGKTYKVQWESRDDSRSGPQQYGGYVAVCVFTADKELIDFKTPYGTNYYNGVSSGYNEPGIVSGVNGTVYIRVNLYIKQNPHGPERSYTENTLSSGYTSSYNIKVFQ